MCTQETPPSLSNGLPPAEVPCDWGRSHGTKEGRVVGSLPRLLCNRSAEAAFKAPVLERESAAVPPHLSRRSQTFSTV